MQLFGIFMNSQRNRLSARFRYPVTIAIACVIFSLGLSRFSHGQSNDEKNTSFTDEQLEFFESKVRPLLVERCFECHGPDAKPIEGGLSLASRKDILNGGDTGAAIEPNHPDKSLLIDAINCLLYTSPSPRDQRGSRMPSSA